MADVEISSLAIEVGADAGSASKELNELASALSRLAANSKVTRTVNALNKLKSALSGLQDISPAVQSVSRFGDAMQKLASMPKLSGLNSAINTLRKLPEAAAGLNPAVFSSLASAVEPLNNALGNLGNIEKLSGLNSAINTLKKLPDLAKEIKNVDFDDFAAQLERVRSAIAPLASEMDKIGRGFAALPANIQKAIMAGQRWSSAAHSMGTASDSLWSKIKQLAGGFSLLYIVQRVGQFLGQALANFNDYVENVNLFNVSMGEFSGTAAELTQRMQDLLGVDASAAMRNMGVIQNLVTSFGMAGDQAYVLSSNLTQLGYDMASFFNIPIEDSFQKLQAAISGELEPIRRLGVDISEARLQQELYALGIDQSVSSLNQADKAMLRYIAIMEQTTNAQTDMARTLNSPANQIRIFQQQITLLARSIGSLLIPALNAILPPVIAVVQVLRQAIQAIAGFFGIEVQFASVSVDTGASLGGISSGLDDVGSSAGAAADAVKMLIGGFDELNVLPEPSSGSGGGGAGGGGGGGLGDIALPSYDMFDGLSEKINSMVEKVKAALKTILPIVAGIAAGFAAWKIGNAVMKALPTIMGFLGKIPLALSNAAAILTGPFSKGLAEAGSTVGKAFSLTPLMAFTAAVAIIAAQFTNLLLNSQSFRDGLSNAFDTAKASLSGLWDGLVEGIQPAIAAITGLGQQILNLIPPGVRESVAEFFQSIGEMASKLELNIGDVLTTIAGLVLLLIPGGQIAGIAVLVFEGLTVGLRAFGNANDETVEKIKNGFKTAFEFIGKTVSGVISGIVTFITETFGGAIDFIQGIFTGNWEQAFTGIQRFSQSAITGIGTFIKTVFGVDVLKILDNARTSFFNWAGDVKDRIVERFQALPGAIGQVFSELISNAMSWGSDMINGFVQGLQNAWSGLKNGVMGIANSIASYLHFSRPDVGPLRDYETWMPDMVKGLSRTLEQSAPMLGKAAKGLASRVEVDAMLAPETGYGAYTTVQPRGRTGQGSRDSDIVAAINALGALLQQQGDTRVIIDGREVFRTVKQQAQREQMRTGRPAFT